MKYTYKISGYANSELFSDLKKEITELYPDFSFEKENKDADGSSVAFFGCGQTGERIAAELSYANNNIVVTSDIRMTELAEKYNIAHAKGTTNHIDFREKLNAVLGTPLGVKAFILPVCLMIIIFILNSIFSGGIYFSFIGQYFEALLAAFYMLIAYGGGLMFIPAALLSLWLAEKNNNFLYKLPLSAFMLFSELHLLIFYIYDFSFADIAVLFTGLLFLLNIVPILPTLYIIMLPLIITDELSARKHEKNCGKRIKWWRSAIWWSVTAAVMFAAFLIFGTITTSINHSEEEQISAIETADIHEAIDPLLDKYEDEMRTVSDYALSHNYYDWYCCPDESVRSEWKALFGNDSEYIFDYTLNEYSSCRFIVHINGEGRRSHTIRFDGEDIYVDNTLYSRTEGDFEI